MKLIISMCFLLSTTAVFGQEYVFWKNLNDQGKSAELAKSYTAESIEEFYFGKRHAGDSISVDALMGTLSKADSLQLPFYFEVFCSKMIGYKDSLATNLYTVHVINMLHYHPAYTLTYLDRFDDPHCENMFREALQFGFQKMQWFYSGKTEFREELEPELNKKQLKLLNELMQ